MYNKKIFTQEWFIQIACIWDIVNMQHCVVSLILITELRKEFVIRKDIYFIFHGKNHSWLLSANFAFKN